MRTDAEIWRNLATVDPILIKHYLPKEFGAYRESVVTRYTYAGYDVIEDFTYDSAPIWLEGLSDQAKTMLTGMLFDAEEAWQAKRRERPIKVMQALGLINGT